MAKKVSLLHVYGRESIKIFEIILQFYGHIYYILLSVFTKPDEIHIFPTFLSDQVETMRTSHAQVFI